jgi:SAM-dependent methyltransferase
MDTLTLEQLEKVPWNKKYVQGAHVPKEPDISQIHEVIKVPFVKRNQEFNLFYSWFEITKMAGNKNMIVLDTCCGRGQIAEILHLKGNKVFGCDIGDHFCAEKKDIEFKLTDLNNPFPYNNNSFDVIINCEGLEHLNDSEHYISECRRILKPGGRLIVSVPNIHSVSSQISFFRKGTLMSYNVCLPSRKNIIYLPLFKAQLEKYHFSIINISGNVPTGKKLIKLFSLLTKPYSAHKENPYIRFAHSLIIESKLNY